MWILFHYRSILIEIFPFNLRRSQIQALMISRTELGCTSARPILLGQNQARWTHAFHRNLLDYMQLCLSLYSRCYRLLYALVLNGNHIELGPSIHSCIEVPIFESQFGA